MYQEQDMNNSDDSFETLKQLQDLASHFSNEELVRIIPGLEIKESELVPFEPRLYGNVKVKKLHPDARIPEYQTSGASGFDLHALENYTIYSGETELIRTGLAFELPPDTEIQIRPRSGLSLKTPLRVANSPGTIDEDFRGEVCIIITNTDTSHLNVFPGNAMVISKGDRIAQGVLVPVLKANFIESEELSDSNRGSVGFGSSGK